MSHDSLNQDIQDAEHAEQVVFLMLRNIPVLFFTTLVMF